MTIVDGKLEWQERPDPEPGVGEVLVAVRAAGINAGDLLQLAGHYPAPPGSPPDVPGLELTSEVVAQTTAAGLGQSTTIGVGGDPVHGIGLADSVRLFLDDPATEGIILIGEIGGNDEEEAASLIKDLEPDKPVVALVVGRHAPAQQRMGHAGALAAGQAGSAEAKMNALREAGVLIAPRADLVGETMRQALVG